ncbi:MAG: dockerin type I domain-containing protein [Oscillospiraceae bacterium]|nr:dockerin type I domain-containing protein [Oscillospiraceae bacterium]
MKSEVKKQWTQIVAVAAATVCALGAVFSGVNGSLGAPINAYALEAGDEIASEVVTNTDGSYFGIDLSGATAEDAGKTVYVTLKTSDSSYFNQGWVGTVGYWDNSTASMVQDDWSATADSTGACQFTFNITEGMIGRSDIQLQCWYPTVADIDSCTLVVEQDTPAETTTTTEETTTTTTTEETGITTTTTTETGDSEDTTTTTTTTTTQQTTTTTVTTTTTATGSSEEVKYTTGTQKGTDGDIQAFAEFKPGDAKYAVIVYKVLSDDLKSSGAVGTWHPDTDWVQEEFDLPVDENGLVTVTYQIPEKVGSTVKAMVFYPSNKEVSFQSITLYYDDAPSSSTTTTGGNGELTFTSVKINDHNYVEVINKCYLSVTLKAPAGTTMSGAVYYDNVTLDWSGTADADGLIKVGFPIRSGLDKCDFQIQNSGNQNSVQGNFTSYYPGDASLNGIVNGSDVRAIINYLKGTAKEEIKDSVCDYDRSGKVELLDAVSLIKGLIGLGTIPGSN